VTAGLQAGDGTQEGVLDAVVPLRGDEDLLLFADPRFSVLSGPEEEVNVGVGCRQFLKEPGVILGGNLFYDSRWTRYGHQFEQAGAGLEALSEWVDFRFNYYLPEALRQVISERDEVTVCTTTARHVGRRYRDDEGALVRDIVTTTTRLPSCSRSSRQR
jgi:hypothetical protein